MFGCRIGAFAYHHIPVRKKEALHHLKIAFPNRTDSYYERLLKSVYNHFGFILVDVMRMTGRDVNNRITVENRDVLDKAIDAGKGVLILTGHLGNWEMLGAWFGLNGYKLYPIARRLKNRGADRFITEIRRHQGTFPINDKVSVNEMVKIIRAENILFIVGDQDARRKGVFVQFFNIPSSTPRGAAIFSLKTGAPIIFSLCYRNRDGTYCIKHERIPTDIEEGDPVTIITQRFTSKLEEEIRNHPDQYFWFHKRWKTKPKPGKR